MKVVRIVLALLAVAALVGAVVWLLAESSDSVRPLVAAALGFLASKMYENFREGKQQLHDKKREVYANLLKPYRDILLSAIDGDAEAMASPPVREGMEAAFEAILYASDDVVKEFGAFRSTDPASEPQALVLVRFARVMKAMRKDLGHTYTSLTEADLLWMFVNLTPADLENMASAQGAE